MMKTQKGLILMAAAALLILITGGMTQTIAFKPPEFDATDFVN